MLGHCPRYEWDEWSDSGNYAFVHQILGQIQTLFPMQSLSFPHRVTPLSRWLLSLFALSLRALAFFKKRGLSGFTCTHAPNFWGPWLGFQPCVITMAALGLAQVPATERSAEGKILTPLLVGTLGALSSPPGSSLRWLGGREKSLLTSPVAPLPSLCTPLHTWTMVILVRHVGLHGWGLLRLLGRVAGQPRPCLACLRAEGSNGPPEASL